MKYAIFALALFTVPLAAAQPPPEPERNLVDFDVQREAQVEPDTIEAVVFTESEDVEASVASGKANQAINEVIELAGAYKQIDSQSQGYSTRPVYQDNMVRGWRARRELRLRSQDFDAVGEVLARLGVDVSIQSVRFTISRALMEKTRDGLMLEALGAFRQRGELVAGALGMKGYEIVRISLSGHGAEPVYRARALEMAAAAQSAAPDISAGTTAVTVGASGTIRLLDE